MLLIGGCTADGAVVVRTGLGVGVDGDGARPELLRAHPCEVDGRLAVHARGLRRVGIELVAGDHPHAVVLRSELSRNDLLRLGPAIESHPRFPNRTNVQLARPEPRDVVSVLVWERGAGETAASGSSAAAVAAAAVARGWCDSPVRVSMSGGSLVVAVERGLVSLEGPAERICEGTTPL